jgi:hypothetical protein
MTAPITLLKFWGRPMYPTPTGFFTVLRELDLIVKIHDETPKQKCHWSVFQSGAVVVTNTASGVKAARNAAQKWLADRARKTLEMSTKGRAE